jgi:hypothetical protein
LIEKGKVVEKQRRKATGLKRTAMIAELPGNLIPALWDLAHSAFLCHRHSLRPFTGRCQMESSNLLPAITPIPFLSVMIWIVLILTAMYLARKPFHRSMASFSRIIYNGMRLLSRSVTLAEKRINERNRTVLLSAGLELVERKVEREFDRIGLAVQKELEGFPQIQRKIGEQLQKMEEDYAKCGEIPQVLPDWVKVIEAIANIKPNGDRMVINMLEDIHHTLDEQHKSAAERHRRDVAERHRILGRMQPAWRSLQKILGTIERTFGQLGHRSKKIDRYVEHYEKTRSHSDMAERQLSSSALTQFFISAVVLAVAAVGAVINFNLIALPMSEMVGGASYIGMFKTSDVAGMFVVSLEIVVGIFLMDALRITRLFSIIGSMEDNKRKAIFWFLLLMLTVLAGFESSLAFMRDRIAADMEALRQSLAGIEPTDAAASRIPMIGQMVMGFILPFILTFVAIPFESFVSSARTVLGILTEWALRIVAFGLRMIGNLGFYSGRMIINIYDLVIFPGLWLEGVISRSLTNSGKQKEKRAAEAQLEQEDVTLIERRTSCSKITD